MTIDLTRREMVAALAFAALGAPRLPLHGLRADTIEWLRERVPKPFAAAVAQDMLQQDSAWTSASNVAFARGLAPETPKGLERMQRAIAQDYAAGRVVTVQGWVVSLTEARLVAAAA